MSSAASFTHHVVNINLSELASAYSLADVIVAKYWFTNTVYIVTASGNIAPIISRIKCNMLWISKMSLSTEVTAALILGV